MIQSIEAVADLDAYQYVELSTDDINASAAVKTIQQHLRKLQKVATSESSVRSIYFYQLMTKLNCYYYSLGLLSLMIHTVLHYLYLLLHYLLYHQLSHSILLHSAEFYLELFSLNLF